MLSRASWVVFLLMLAAVPSAFGQDKKFSVKVATTEPPKELNDSIRKLFSNDSVQFFDAKGALICELWFAKDLQSDATAEQVKNGLTLRDLKESQIVAAARFDQTWHDYRQQKVKPGVYTFRLGFQPADGDHLGKSAFTEFLLLSAAARDKSTDLMPFKSMVEMSAKSVNTGHPGVFMLFPIEKPGQPAVEARNRDHWTVNVGCSVKAAGGKGMIGLGLTLVGEADE